ncbi:MAG: class I SAM-dependent DNA methyltransferase, partial [Abditibacteriota bacterium]|nr:class I SAM-dependent DNA methyltransferase [Abditibacteriota bacterium]
MPINRQKAREFALRWAGKGNERQDCQRFWLELLEDVLEYNTDSAVFEEHMPDGSFCDVWLKDAGIMIEQKSLNVDLDAVQSSGKTPLQQVQGYAEQQSTREQPQYLITCKFDTFRIYDRKAFNSVELRNHYKEFSLEEFGRDPELLKVIIDSRNFRIENDKQINMDAGLRISKLYQALGERYINDTPEALHALNVLCVRLVFCLYCEDAGIFESGSFISFVKRTPAEQLRRELINLFRVLDTPIAERDPYNNLDFPYVNGGLFRDETEIPNFTTDIKAVMAEAANFDWSQISPTIFGGIFESTLNPESRRSGGMHYTTPQNIHRLIGPLFLDGLRNELAAIKKAEGETPRDKRRRLEALQAKMRGLTFFDPACGSGNFLTETYLCLRRLEDSLLREIKALDRNADL